MRTNSLTLIFAVDKNWSIGLDGDMHVYIKKDLKRFKELTLGNVLVMGRKTLESLPGSKPLDKRTTIVLTRRDIKARENLIVVNSIDDLFNILDDIDACKKIFVSGGQRVVEQLIDYCDYAYITKILYAFPESDTKIPNLDADSRWELVKESELLEENGIKFQYVDYKRK